VSKAIIAYSIILFIPLWIGVVSLFIPISYNILDSQRLWRLAMIICVSSVAPLLVLNVIAFALKTDLSLILEFVHKRHTMRRIGEMILIIIFSGPALLACIFLLTHFLTFINCALDAAPITERTANVLEKRIQERFTKSAGNKRYAATFQTNVYSIVVKSWITERTTETMRVPKEIHDRVVPMRDNVSVVTKPGWLGFEWVQYVKLDEGHPGPGQRK